MAQITKTIVYPVPTEWYGDNQDTNRSGICTYTGPDRITFWYVNNGTDADPIWEVEHSFPSDPGEDRDPPAGARVIELNADTHPMNAVAMYGGILPPEQIVTPAGPDSEPDPILDNYLYFNEVYDMCSFGYNFETSLWNTGRFSGPHTEIDLEDETASHSFGWEEVRRTRDKLLAESDGKIPSDAPEGYTSQWTEYRQKLRELPNTWSSVGNNTYLIVWPREPGDREAFTGASPETGLDSTDITTEGA